MANNSAEFFLTSSCGGLCRCTSRICALGELRGIQPQHQQWPRRRRACLPCHLSLIKSKRPGVHSPSKQMEIWRESWHYGLRVLMQARKTQSLSAFSRKSLAFAPCFLSCSIREQASRCQIPCQSSEYCGNRVLDFPMLAKVVQERTKGLLGLSL